MLKIVSILCLLPVVFAAPLASNSLILSRMPVSVSAPSQVTYQSAVLEEWMQNANGYSLAQTWNTTCTNLPTDGKLQPSLPYLTDAYMLCRAVPRGSATTVSPAVTVLGRLTEAGVWSMVTEFGSTFPNGTALHSLMVIEPEHTMYSVGGGLAPQPNHLTALNISSGKVLGTYQNTNNMFELVLYNNSLNVLANPPPASGGGTASPAVITNTISLANGGPYIMPTGWSISSALSIPETQGVVWFMISAPKPSIVRLNLTVPLLNETFGPPPKAGAGAAQFKLLSGRYELRGYTVYLTNGSHIVSNTIAGLRTKSGYTIVAHAPPGWNYNSMVARQPLVTGPSPTPTPSPTLSPSPTVSVTVMPTIVASVSPTLSISYSVTPTTSPGMSTTFTTSPGTSVTPTMSPSISETPTISHSATPTISASISFNPTVSFSPTVSVSYIVSVSSTVSISPTVSITPTVSISPTVSITPTVSISPTVSITPTVSISPTVSITPTASYTSSSTVSLTQTPTISWSSTPTVTPTGSTQALVNGISAGGSAQTPINTISTTGIAIIAALGGILGTIIVFVISRRYRKRTNPMSYRTPKAKTFTNRMERPMHTIEISNNPAVQQWNQSASMSVRHLNTARPKRTFEPVVSRA